MSTHLLVALVSRFEMVWEGSDHRLVVAHTGVDHTSKQALTVVGEGLDAPHHAVPMLPHSSSTSSNSASLPLTMGSLALTRSPPWTWRWA